MTLKCFVVSIFLILIAIPDVIAQNDKEKIEIEKIFGGYRYTQNGRTLKMNQLVNKMRFDELAYPKIKTARLNNTLATIFGATGGFLIAYPIGTAIANGEPNWTLAYIGAGLIVLSIPISILGNKKAAEAVKIYNANLFDQASHFKESQLRLNISGVGLGLTLKF